MSLYTGNDMEYTCYLSLSYKPVDPCWIKSLNYKWRSLISHAAYVACRAHLLLDWLKPSWKLDCWVGGYFSSLPTSAAIELSFVCTARKSSLHDLPLSLSMLKAILPKTLRDVLTLYTPRCKGYSTASSGLIVTSIVHYFQIYTNAVLLIIPYREEFSCFKNVIF